MGFFRGSHGRHEPPHQSWRIFADSRCLTLIMGCTFPGPRDHGRGLSKLCRRLTAKSELKSAGNCQSCFEPFQLPEQLPELLPVLPTYRQARRDLHTVPLKKLSRWMLIAIRTCLSYKEIFGANARQATSSTDSQKLLHVGSYVGAAVGATELATGDLNRSHLSCQTERRRSLACVIHLNARLSSHMGGEYGCACSGT